MNKKVFLIIFCISLPLLLLLISYKTTIYFSDLTLNQEKTMNFLNDNEDLTLNYTAKEVSHLQDVKKVMISVNYLFYFFLSLTTLIIIYHRNDLEEIKRLIRFGGITTVLLILFIIMTSIISFNYSFTVFHQIFFPQGNWIFPFDSLLIQTFPLSFFIYISRTIFLQALLLGSLFIFVSFYLKNENIHKRD
ncbi:MAG: DUF1461 domain-containing protein [Nanoarchaeota archaeon]|nr:DUF1461 domain-containing protein [Nanoarchaeota archaeon]MBU1632574.1 DUF1461 domain-containing protein [Nanoarchaeota archaeon]MBU1875785.1 DUF1461 domain-containing protein [Nanoarchaeota archaeon]